MNKIKLCKVRSLIFKKLNKKQPYRGNPSNSLSTWNWSTILYLLGIQTLIHFFFHAPFISNVIQYCQNLNVSKSSHNYDWMAFMFLKHWKFRKSLCHHKVVNQTHELSYANLSHKIHEIEGDSLRAKLPGIV